MKKFLAMALAAVMVIGVAGCGSSSETPAEGDGAEASTSGENVIKFGSIRASDAKTAAAVFRKFTVCVMQTRYIPQ